MNNPQLIKKPVFYHAVAYFSCLEIKNKTWLLIKKPFYWINFS